MIGHHGCKRYQYGDIHPQNKNQITPGSLGIYGHLIEALEIKRWLISLVLYLSQTFNVTLARGCDGQRTFYKMAIFRVDILFCLKAKYGSQLSSYVRGQKAQKRFLNVFTQFLAEYVSYRYVISKVHLCLSSLVDHFHKRSHQLTCVGYRHNVPLRNKWCSQGYIKRNVRDDDNGLFISISMNFSAH